MIPALQAFIDHISNSVGFTPEFTESDRDAMLGLTGVAAHTVVRPAAPFASLAVGYLVGSGKAASWAEANDLIKRLTREHAGDPAPEPRA